MGSIEGYAKGQQPMLDRIKEHNAAYNAAVQEIAARAPLRLHVLACFGWARPLYDWLARQPISFEARR